MRETYKEFLERIDSFEKKELAMGNDEFVSEPSVANKVDKQNCFKKFYGDTIVFNLNDAIKRRIESIVERLYEETPECFAEKLAWHTYHVTLHDLSNSPELEKVAQEIFWNELKVISCAEKVLDLDLRSATIKMKIKCIFNMVNTSLVLGLYPADDVEYEKMMRLYEMFDEVKTLSYPLTPHITLAYYNVNGFSLEVSKRLCSIVSELNEQIAEHEIELNCRELFYQKFVSMNEYIDVVPVVGNFN